MPDQQEANLAVATPSRERRYGLILRVVGGAILAFALIGAVFLFFQPRGLEDSWRGHGGEPIGAVVFSPDGKILATGGEDGMVRLWEMATHKERAVLRGHRGWIESLAFSPDGKLLASGGRDGFIRLWDVATGKELHVLTEHASPVLNGVPYQGSVLAVAFSPDGRMLASSGNDFVIRLWDVGTWKERAVLHGHHDRICALVFAPDGKVLFSGAERQIIKRWDPSTGKELQPLNDKWQVMVGEVSLALSPNGKTLVCQKLDSKIRIWDVEKGQERKYIYAPGWVNAIAISPDSKILAAVYQWGELGLWNLEDGELLSKAPFDYAHAIAFSPDGKLLASVKNRVCLWNVEKLLQAKK